MIGTWQVRKLFQNQLEPAPPPLHAGSLKGGVTRGASGLGVLDTEQLNALKATEQLQEVAETRFGPSTALLMKRGLSRKEVLMLYRAAYFVEYYPHQVLYPALAPAPAPIAPTAVSKPALPPSAQAGRPPWPRPRSG